MMSLRVWPRAPRSGANKMSNVVDIDNIISGARGVDDDDDAINNGGGTAIPERQQLRRGQLWRFIGVGGNDRDCGRGNCDGCGNDKEGDMVMRQRHNATTTMTMTTMMTATRQQLHKVKKHIICLIFFNSPCATEVARRHANPWNMT